MWPGIRTDLWPGIWTDLFVVDHIHERLGDGHLPDAAHVEAVHVVPPVDLVVLVLPVLARDSMLMVISVLGVREHLVTGHPDHTQ